MTGNHKSAIRYSNRVGIAVHHNSDPEITGYVIHSDTLHGTLRFTHILSVHGMPDSVVPVM